MEKKLGKSLALSSFLAVAVFGALLHTNVIKLPIQRDTDMQYLAAFTDDRVVAGYLDNIFVGKIVRQVGTTSSEFGPVSQFEVAVLSNIKGNFTGTVRVNQYAGYQNGILYTLEGETPLRVGASYMLGSRYYDGANWFSPLESSKKVLSQDKNLSVSAIQALADKDGRVAELKNAVKNQLFLDAAGNIKTAVTKTK